MEAQDPPRGSGRCFDSADAYWNLPAVVLKLWPASASSGEIVKDLDVQAPSQTFGIRIPMGGLWTFVSLTSSPGDYEAHQSLGITQVKGNREGPAHLLTMCPCVLPQGFQKDDQQDKMNWGGG